ncbi:MAG TPA: type II secretion system protein [Blastocatellia bacterium]
MNSIFARLKTVAANNLHRGRAKSRGRADRSRKVAPRGRRSGRGQNGYALLGMLLALTVMSIMLVGIVPSAKIDIQRSKEEEMVFRGKQMAEGIARYYSAGRLSPLQLVVPPPYGYLFDLNKLGDGVQIGAVQLKFVRHEALQDPMVSKDWVPVRARDPRLMGALQAYAAYNLTTIPQSYLLLAAAPTQLTLVQPNQNGQGGSTQGGPNGQTSPSPSPSPGVSSSPQPGTNGTKTGAAAKGDDDDDDDDDDSVNKPADPLAHLLQDSEHGLPIVGVAPNLKGKAVHPLWGLTNYEQWVFIYLPPQPLLVPGAPTGGQPLQPRGNGNGGLTPGVGGGAGTGTVRPVQQ